MTCEAQAIRSHSVQNSRVLDLLVRDGHVKALGKRIDKMTGPVIQFEDVGRNEATTFTGFCAEHDAKIFAAIETEVSIQRVPSTCSWPPTVLSQRNSMLRWKLLIESRQTITSVCGSG